MSAWILHSSLAAAGLLLLVMAVVNGVIVGRRRHPGWGLLMTALRLCLLATLATLVWKVFWDLDSTSESQELSRERQILVLQDASHSMAFGAGAGRGRHQVADALTEELRRRAQEQRRVSVERLYFARNVVAEDQRARLAADSTRLGAAVGRTLARRQADAVVVISDGAATDGPVPPHLVQWAANRRLGLYALGVGDRDTGIDLAVEEVECAANNPETLNAVIRMSGPVREAVAVEVSFDRKPARTYRLDPGPRRAISARVPTLDTGWHEYAVRIVPAAGEITTLNNLERGVFKVTPPHRILFLWETPRMENRHLIRFLRQRFPERVTVLSTREAQAQPPVMTDYVLAVFADVRPGQVPVPVLDAVRSGRTAAMVLHGRQFGDWPFAQLPDFPVGALRETVNLGQQEAAPATIEVAADLRQGAFRYLDVQDLELNILHRIQPATRHDTILQARVGRQTLPLLLADSAERPRGMALLCDTTWKWAVAPEPRVRAAYRAFWSTVFSWALGESEDARQLHVDFERPAEAADVTVVRVSPVHGDLEDFAVPELTVEAAPTQVVTMTAAADAWRYPFANPPERPAIIWFQAISARDGRAVESVRTPLLLPIDAAELLDPAPHPERLQALVPDPELQFAPAADAGALFDRLFESLEPRRRSLVRRQRNVAAELTLAAICAILLTIEWFIERHLKHHPPAAGD